MWEVILSILGFFIGIVAAITGIGGGIFIVTLLILVYSFTPTDPVGTSLAAILIITIAATVGCSRQKRVRYKTDLLLAATTVPGAIIGAFMTSVTTPGVLGLAFGFFFMLIAFG